MPDVKQLSDSRQQRIVESVKRKIKHDPSLIAQHIGIPSGTKAVSSEQERKMYWTADPEVVRDPDTYWDQALQASGAAGKAEETMEQAQERARMLFVHKLYPARMNLIRSGSRALSVQEQIDFANHMEELGPPNQESESP